MNIILGCYLICTITKPRWKFVLYVTELSLSPFTTSQLVSFPPFLMSPLITFKYLKPFLTERSKGAWETSTIFLQCREWKCSTINCVSKRCCWGCASTIFIQWTDRQCPTISGVCKRCYWVCASTIFMQCTDNQCPTINGVYRRCQWGYILYSYSARTGNALPSTVSTGSVTADTPAWVMTI